MREYIRESMTLSYTCLFRLLISTRHPCLSGVLLVVDPRTDTKKTFAHNMLASLASVVNIIGGRGEGRIYMST